MKPSSHEREDARVSIVVLTFNRRARVLATLRRLQSLHGQWPIIVVDNGSQDGTAAAIAAEFPAVLLIRSRRNLGAAARNIGAAYVHTPYIAFCDDHVQWDPDALERGVNLLDASHDIAVLSTSIRSCADTGDGAPCVSGRDDCSLNSFPQTPRLQGFLAGACIVRTRAFCEVGGYWPPLFKGGEETLLALDLAERGWSIVYASDVIARTLTSSQEHEDTECLVNRNLVWVAWMRLPARIAWRITVQQLGRAHKHGHLWRTALGVIMGLPQVLNRRHVVSAAVQRLKPQLDF